MTATLAGSGIAVSKSTSGTVILSAANTYSGGTTVNGGVLQLTNGGALGSGTASVAAGAQIWLNANNLTIPNSITLSGTTAGGAVVGGLQPAANVAAISGTITLNATSNIANWWNDKTLALSGQITGGGGLILDCATSLGNPVGGRFLISGSANNYQGSTIVNGASVGQGGYPGQAMLYLGANNALPTTTNLTLNYADLYLNGYSQQLPSINGSGTFTVQNGSTTPATLTLGAGDTSSTFSGVIEDNGLAVNHTGTTFTNSVTGSVALVKSGSGLRCISAARTAIAAVQSSATARCNSAIAAPLARALWPPTAASWTWRATVFWSPASAAPRARSPTAAAASPR